MVYRQIAVINFLLRTPIGKELPGTKVGTESIDLNASEEAGSSFLWNSIRSTLFEVMHETRKTDACLGRREASDTTEAEIRKGVSKRLLIKIEKYGSEGQYRQIRSP